MKPKYGISLPTLAIAVVVAAGAQQSTAEPVEPKAPVTAATVGETVKDKQAHYIHLRYVSPSLVAWWLDPRHNPMPESAPPVQSAEAFAPGGEYNPYKPAAEADRKADRKLKTGAFGLPAGVDQIIPIDTQNALLVYGTAEGAGRLKTIISYLDKPIPQIEIEAFFVQTSPETLKEFSIDWSNASSGPFTGNAGGTAATPAPGTFNIGYVRGNLLGTLKAMIAAGRVKTISSPRVTAMNNHTASIYSSTSVPVVLGLKDDKGEFRALRDATNSSASARQTFFLTTKIGFTATPTVNNDKTITLVLQPAPVVLLTAANDKRYSIPISTPDVQTIVNLRDGDTIAVSGLSVEMTRMENLLVKEDKDDLAVKKGDDLIIFVTARIIHRAEETKATVPAAP